MESSLELEYIEVDELVPYEKNQRIHSTDAIGSIKFEISESKYTKWLNKVHKKVGKESESIEREIKARLGL